MFSTGSYNFEYIEKTGTWAYLTEDCCSTRTITANYITVMTDQTGVGQDFQLRILAVSIVILLQSEHSEAMTISDIPELPFNNMQDSNTGFILLNIDLKWSHAHLLMLLPILSLIYLIFILNNLCRRRSAKTSLCLEIVNETDSVFIELVHLPFSCSSVDVILPNSITDLQVQGSCTFPLLSVEWPHFVVMSKFLPDVKLTVPNTFQLSWTQAYRLRRILRQPFLIQLYKKHHNNIMIPLDS